MNAKPDSLLPLTPAVFHILIVLVDGERHGYSMMKEIAANTRGQVRMGPGTLYGSIKRMITANLIEESDERPDPASGNDERRRYYRITPFGRRVIAAEAKRLSLLVELVRARRLLADSSTSGEV